MTLGFVGFGEAAFHIAAGLQDAGLTGIVAYDIHARTLGTGEIIRNRATQARVRLVESNAELAGAATAILSTVIANQAFAAAQQTAPFLSSRHLYADLNSVSPDLKRSLAALVEATGAHFAEVAIMAPVPPHGHRVPMLAGGHAAEQLAALLQPYGMRIEAISNDVGTAAATKMFRSIMVKGMEALVTECVLAATAYGAAERVFASLEESFPGMLWNDMASYMMGRVVEHGERRAREMEEVARTVRSAGVDPLMAEATVRRMDSIARLDLKSHFSGQALDDYLKIAEAVREIESRSRHSTANAAQD